MFCFHPTALSTQPLRAVDWLLQVALDGVGVLCPLYLTNVNPLFIDSSQSLQWHMLFIYVTVVCSIHE